MEERIFSEFPVLKQFSLCDKSIMITGSGSGLGKIIAKGFAMAGASVVLADCNYESVKEVSNEITLEGYKALPLQVDVTKAAEVKAAVQATVNEFGCLDGLVNCAGITRAHAARGVRRGGMGPRAGGQPERNVPVHEVRGSRRC